MNKAQFYKYLCSGILAISILAVLLLSLEFGSEAPIVLFDLCCEVMQRGAELSGLTYEEICVLGNIYFQGFILVISALSVVYAIIRKREEHSLVTKVSVWFAVFYGLMNIGGYILVCHHYWGPLDRAFHMCVRELNTFGDVYNVGYIGANLIIFVFGWLAMLLLNSFLVYIIKK